MGLIKAVMFDLDGVIVDTATYHFLAWRKLCLELGYNLSKDENEFLKGLSREESLSKILNLSNLNVSEHKFKECLNYKNTYYLEFIEDISSKDILPGVRTFLEYLKKKSIKISLCSSSKNAKKIIQKLELNSFFNFIVDGNDIKKSKPDPEIFLRASKKLDVKPEYCLVFEDAQSGINAANEAGMLVIGIGDKKKLRNTEYCLSSFKEIPDVFKKTFFNE
ncbi:MAG: beta-phosphoglucomutase [Bacteroidota bacterium]|nr:beta-phosphoglucomutase [Bacteroidota bacterium]